MLNRNPKHRLGANRDAAELKEHPFFKGIDWQALALKQVTPPFKPNIESDESVANFDSEFTSADLREVGIFDGDLDEEDPSESWTSSYHSSSLAHTYTGPLGSERQLASPPLSMSNGAHGKSQIIQIKPKKKKKDHLGSPLTSSVQENFRGFTYHGGESIAAPVGFLGRRGREDEDAVDTKEVPELTTEQEIEDTGRPAGRYANIRKKDLALSSLDDGFL